MARMSGGQITVRPSEDQRMRWGDASVRLGHKHVRAFLAWAADFTARYTLEQYVQGLHRQKDPFLLRLEEKKRLRCLLDAARYALDFLPPPSPCPLRGSLRDPKGDLRKALDGVDAYLAEVREEY